MDAAPTCMQGSLAYKFHLDRLKNSATHCPRPDSKAERGVGSMYKLKGCQL